MYIPCRPSPVQAERSFTFSIPVRVSFRPLEAGDLWALYQHCWPEKTLDEIEELLARVFKRRQQRRGEALVVLVDDEVCAFGMVTAWRGVGEISDLIVRAELRGHGIGTGLITALADLAREFRLPMLEIGAFAWNTRAIALYSRLGFVEHRRVEINLASHPETIIYLRKATQEA